MSTEQGLGLAAEQSILAELFRHGMPLAGQPLLDARIGAIAAGSERLSPVEQLDIYREQFFLRHIDVLRDDFRSIAQLIGDDAFDALAEAYLAAQPPASFTLRDLGYAMHRFVGARAPWSADPLLADLARVEWAFVEAFDAPDAPPLDLATITSVSEEAWPGARLIFQPAVQLLSLAHAAHDFRVAVHRGEVVSRPPPAPFHVVVYRGPEHLHCLEIEPDAFALLDELGRGTPLGEACERVLNGRNASRDAGGANEQRDRRDPIEADSEAESAAEEFQRKLGGWFQHWTSLGWISRVEF